MKSGRFLHWNIEQKHCKKICYVKLFEVNIVKKKKVRFTFDFQSVFYRRGRCLIRLSRLSGFGIQYAAREPKNGGKFSVKNSKTGIRLISI